MLPLCLTVINDKLSTYFVCHQINLQNRECNKNHFSFSSLLQIQPFGWCKSRRCGCSSLLGPHLYSRITEVLRVEWISGDRLVQPPAQNRVSQRRLLKAMSSRVLSTFTTSLGNLVQCLTTLSVKKCLVPYQPWKSRAHQAAGEPRSQHLRSVSLPIPIKWKFRFSFSKP